MFTTATSTEQGHATHNTPCAQCTVYHVPYVVSAALSLINSVANEQVCASHGQATVSTTLPVVHGVRVCGLWYHSH